VTDSLNPMPTHLFLFGSPVSRERLSWIADALKIFFVNRLPEAFRQPTIAGAEPVASFFLTGDALYSLHDRDTLPLWESILSLTAVRVTCDREEMDLRGISVEALKVKFPQQVLDQNGRRISHPRSFWRGLVQAAGKSAPGSAALGYLQLSSPYMHRSAGLAVSCLQAALEEGVGAELYAYLDGVHAGHVNQRPSEERNVGEGIEELDRIARKRALPFQAIACERCAAARGYSTWDDGKGVAVSACTIPPVKIRNLNAVVARFATSRVILGEDAGDVSTAPAHRLAPGGWLAGEADPPPVLVLVTRSPYGTEHAFGALSLAIACAHQEIATRVVFLEDGIHALLGRHSAGPDDPVFNLQEVIEASGGRDLQLYAFQPSFLARGITRGEGLPSVLDIGMKELGEILFETPKGIRADRQRVIFF